VQRPAERLKTRACCRFIGAPRWRPQIVFCKARVLIVACHDQDSQRSRAPIIYFRGGPTPRDKGPEIDSMTAIQRSSPLAQSDCVARATSRLAAHSRFFRQPWARTRMRRQQALSHWLSTYLSCALFILLRGQDFPLDAGDRLLYIRARQSLPGPRQTFQELPSRRIRRSLPLERRRRRQNMLMTRQ